MKLIKIKHYTYVDKRYRVPIGNGITRSFDNKKKCLKFLADTNRFLNLKLHELNFLYTDIHAQYRRDWFYFDHHKSPGAKLYHSERTVKNSLKQAEETFDLICERSGFENGNYFVFSHFRAIFKGLKTAVVVLKQIATGRSSAVDIHRLQVLYDRIVFLENEVFSFDGELLKEITDYDEIVTRNSMKVVS